MKFSGFRTFKLGQTVEDVIDYLKNGLALSLKELQNGLTKLSLVDNFESQVLTISIPASSTVQYSHNLGVTPTKRLIVKADGSGLDDSTNAWTSTSVYFRNSSASTINATIIIMR
jgi:hypothetical protein